MKIGKNKLTESKVTVIILGLQIIISIKVIILFFLFK